MIQWDQGQVVRHVTMDINSIQEGHVCHVDHMNVVEQGTMEISFQTVIHAVQTIPVV